MILADKIINNMTKLIKTSANEMNSLFSNIDYYDINNSIDICIAADEVYSQNIRDINSANREAIRFILKSNCSINHNILCVKLFCQIIPDTISDTNFL